MRALFPFHLFVIFNILNNNMAASLMNNKYMKYVLLFFSLVAPFILVAQVPTADSLLGLHAVTSAERSAITGASDGMVVYDADEEAIYVYSETSGWLKNQIGPSTYIGSFIISAAGPQSITGLPFKPSQITFIGHANIEDFNIDSDNAIDNNTSGLQNTHGVMNGFARDDNGSTTQQVIYIGSHGNSVNDITRFASNANCIGLRYTNTNGDDLGKILASFTSFDANGFTVNASYINGTVTVNNSSPRFSVQPDDVLGESVLVLYTAYR